MLIIFLQAADETVAIVAHHKPLRKAARLAGHNNHDLRTVGLRR